MHVLRGCLVFLLKLFNINRNSPKSIQSYFVISNKVYFSPFCFGQRYFLESFTINDGYMIQLYCNFSVLSDSFSFILLIAYIIGKFCVCCISVCVVNIFSLFVRFYFNVCNILIFKVLILIKITVISNILVYFNAGYTPT